MDRFGGHQRRCGTWKFGVYEAGALITHALECIQLPPGLVALQRQAARLRKLHFTWQCPRTLTILAPTLSACSRYSTSTEDAGILHLREAG